MFRSKCKYNDQKLSKFLTIYLCGDNGSTAVSKTEGGGSIPPRGANKRKGKYVYINNGGNGRIIF